jgi:glutathione-specific gamma-glutamylcyclotransferase
MLIKRDELDDARIEQIVADARKAGYDFFLTQEEREASLNQALERYAPGEEAWVFAYGSLMWNPALEYAEASPCHVEGWRRSFCFWVPLGRGTPELPGLMLALEGGGSCEGIAYRIAPNKVRSELAILWNREMLSGVYQARWVPAKLRDGRIVTAVTFVVDTNHCQYCGDLPIERAAHHIAFAEGRRGACRDYLANTAAHARALEIHDPYIEQLVDLVAGLRGESVEPSVPPAKNSAPLAAPGED